MSYFCVLMFRSFHFLKYHIPILFGLFLLTASNTVASAMQLDSLIKPVEIIEFNIQKLQKELDIHFDQLDYLMEEKTDFSSSREIERLNELIEIKQNEIDVINYRIHLHNILLSKARRLEYYPSIQRPTLIKEVLQEQDFLNKRKILFSEIRKKQLPERMKLDYYSYEFPYDCQTTYFSANKLTSSKREALFSYTPAEIEGSIIDKDFLNADISILQSAKKFIWIYVSLLIQQKLPRFMACWRLANL